MAVIGNLFYLPKRTDTHADPLAAVGLAQLLARIGRPTSPRDVSVMDRGTHFELNVSPGLTEDDVVAWDGDPFYPHIKLKDDKDAPLDAIDYEAESAVLSEARKRPKTKGRGVAGKNTEDSRLAEASVAPHPEIAFLRIFNGMRKGFKGDIELNRALRRTPPTAVVRARLHALTDQRRMMQLEPEPPPFSVKVSASQWFLPLSGKGVSRVKANGAGPGQFPEKHIDWFEMWMRFVGMYRCMTQHGFGDGDLKLLVVAPREVDAYKLGQIRDAIRDTPHPIFGGKKAGAVKIEVRAPLELARALVRHSAEYRAETDPHPRLRFASRPVRDIVGGFYASAYKKMGTASSIMNVAFLGVPSWTRIRDRADAEAFLSTLDDLDRYQRMLRDNVSEDIETLRIMRDLVSDGGLDEALRFFARASVDVMRRLAAKEYAHLLSIETVRRILMDLSEQTPIVSRIVNDEGFQRISRAIRAATIHAQLHDSSALQPRYGLAQAWRQVAPHKERFIEALAQFVQRFNADVVRKRETSPPGGEQRYPALVTTDDLGAVIALVEATDSSSSLVANLLLAFGYAQVTKKDAKEHNP